MRLWLHVGTTFSTITGLVALKSSNSECPNLPLLRVQGTGGAVERQLAVLAELLYCVHVHTDTVGVQPGLTAVATDAIIVCFAFLEADSAWSIHLTSLVAVHRRHQR